MLVKLSCGWQFQTLETVSSGFFWLQLDDTSMFIDHMNGKLTFDRFCKALALFNGSQQRMEGDDNNSN